MNLIAAVKDALQPKAPLQERNAVVLKAPDTSSAVLAEQLAETEPAAAAAIELAKAAEARALDPTLDPEEADLAAREAHNATFTARRLAAAMAALTERRDVREREETVAAQWERYRAAEKARDAVAERIKAEYAVHATAIVDLIKAAVDGAAAVKKANTDLPPGADLLNYPDGTARGFIQNGRDGNRGCTFGPISLSAAVIPDLENWEMTLWPINCRPIGDDVSLVHEQHYWHLKAGTRCIVPIRGVTLSASNLEALWDRFYTAAPPRQRRSVERYSGVKRA